LSLTSAPANVQSSTMSDMFQRWGYQATATDPDIYKAQSRGFAVGGSLSIRARNEILQPFSFKAPSIKAGCNGIDIFAGSFSWINAEQFTRTLRAIGQNAVGYAFNLGLEVVCPTCAAQLKTLQNFMNQINKMSADSCTAAKALVNTGAAATMGDMSLIECQNKNTTNNDPVTGWLNCAALAEGDVKAKLKADLWGPPPADGTAPNAQQGGVDVVRQALTGTGLSDEDKKLAISLLGTINMEDPDGSGTFSCQPYAPTITLKDLVEGGTVKLWGCANGSLGDNQQCFGYTRNDEVIDGYRALAVTQLMSIYNKFMDPNGAHRMLTAAEQTFIARIRNPPVFTLIRNLARLGESDRAASESTITQYADLVALEYASATIEMYISAVQNGQKNMITNCQVKDPGYRAGIKAAELSRVNEMRDLLQGLEKQNQAMAFLDRINRQVAKNSRDVFKGAFRLY
jgi:conjugative transfer pilus assembly protein TraH